MQFILHCFRQFSALRMDFQFFTLRFCLNSLGYSLVRFFWFWIVYKKIRKNKRIFFFRIFYLCFFLCRISSILWSFDYQVSLLYIVAMLWTLPDHNLVRAKIYTIPNFMNKIQFSVLFLTSAGPVSVWLASRVFPNNGTMSKQVSAKSRDGDLVT